MSQSSKFIITSSTTPTTPINDNNFTPYYSLSKNSNKSNNANNYNNNNSNNNNNYNNNNKILDTSQQLNTTNINNKTNNNISFISAISESVYNKKNIMEWPMLFQTIIKGSVNDTIKALKKGENPNVIASSIGDTPLIQAIELEKIDHIKVLLDYKADVNIPNSEGYSPLHLAVDKKNIEIVNILLNKNANPNVQNRFFKRTPLHNCIISNSKVDILYALIHYGANCNIVDSKDMTPFEYISDDMIELKKAVDILIKKKSNIYNSNKDINYIQKSTNINYNNFSTNEYLNHKNNNNLVKSDVSVITMKNPEFHYINLNTNIAGSYPCNLNNNANDSAYYMNTQNTVNSNSNLHTNRNEISNLNFLNMLNNKEVSVREIINLNDNTYSNFNTNEDLNIQNITTNNLNIISNKSLTSISNSNILQNSPFNSNSKNNKILNLNNNNPNNINVQNTSSFNSYNQPIIIQNNTYHSFTNTNFENTIPFQTDSNPSSDDKNLNALDVLKKVSSKGMFHTESKNKKSSNKNNVYNFNIVNNNNNNYNFSSSSNSCKKNNITNNNSSSSKSNSGYNTFTSDKIKSSKFINDKTPAKFNIEESASNRKSPEYKNNSSDNLCYSKASNNGYNRKINNSNEIEDISVFNNMNEEFKLKDTSISNINIKKLSNNNSYYSKEEYCLNNNNKTKKDKKPNSYDCNSLINLVLTSKQTNKSNSDEFNNLVINRKSNVKLNKNKTRSKSDIHDAITFLNHCSGLIPGSLFDNIDNNNNTTNYEYSESCLNTSNKINNTFNSKSRLSSNNKTLYSKNNNRRKSASGYNSSSLIYNISKSNISFDGCNNLNELSNNYINNISRKLHANSTPSNNSISKNKINVDNSSNQDKSDYLAYKSIPTLKLDFINKANNKDNNKCILESKVNDNKYCPNIEKNYNKNNSLNSKKRSNDNNNNSNNRNNYISIHQVGSEFANCSNNTITNNKSNINNNKNNYNVKNLSSINSFQINIKPTKKKKKSRNINNNNNCNSSNTKNNMKINKNIGNNNNNNKENSNNYNNKSTRHQSSNVNIPHIDNNDNNNNNNKSKFDSSNNSLDKFELYSDNYKEVRKTRRISTLENIKKDSKENIVVLDTLNNEEITYISEVSNSKTSNDNLELMFENSLKPEHDFIVDIQPKSTKTKIKKAYNNKFSIKNNIKKINFDTVGDIAKLNSSDNNEIYIEDKSNRLNVNNCSNENSNSNINTDFNLIKKSNESKIKQSFIKKNIAYDNINTSIELERKNNTNSNNEYINSMSDKRSKDISNLTISNKISKKLNKNIKYINKNHKSSLKLADWLTELHLHQYINLFLKNELYLEDMIELTKNNDFNEKDLKNIGLEKPGHIYRILTRLRVDIGEIDECLSKFILSMNNNSNINSSLLSNNINNSLYNSKYISEKITCCGFINFYQNINIDKNISNKNNNYINIETWLLKGKLKCLKRNFIHNGFDYLEYILLMLFTKITINYEFIENSFHVYSSNQINSLLRFFYTERNYLETKISLVSNLNNNKHNNIEFLSNNNMLKVSFSNGVKSNSNDIYQDNSSVNEGCNACLIF